MTKGKVKECPFCGSRDIELGALNDFMRGRYMMHCRKCGTAGPLSKQCKSEAEGLKDAIKCWNRRSKDE